MPRGCGSTSDESLSLPADHRCELQCEVDTHGTHLHLSKAYAPGRDLHIGRYQQGQAIAEARLNTQAQVRGGEKIAVLAGAGAGLIGLISPWGTVHSAVLACQQIAGHSGAGKEKRAAGDTKIITKVERYLEHFECSFHVVQVPGENIVLVKIDRRMIILGPGGIVLPVQQ